MKREERVSLSFIFLFQSVYQCIILKIKANCQFTPQAFQNPVCTFLNSNLFHSNFQVLLLRNSCTFSESRAKSICLQFFAIVVIYLCCCYLCYIILCCCCYLSDLPINFNIALSFSKVILFSIIFFSIP